MANLGLKLWSTNKQYFDEAQQLCAEGYFQFIELYAVPNSYEEFGVLWKKLKVPYIIHAPHIKNEAINLAKKELREENKRLFAEVQRFADLLEAQYIVLHPGIGGEQEEIFKQLEEIYDSRILIENMPYMSLWDGVYCQGYDVDFISRLLKKFNIGFCFDIAHAYCAANAINIDTTALVELFLELSPSLYHFSDVGKGEVVDRHLHLGEGGINFKNMKLLKAIEESPVVFETEKKFDNSLADAKEDVYFFCSLFSFSGKEVSLNL